jgi:MFS family permease
VLVAADSAALTAAGMAIAGLGVAAMYPLTLAQLMAVPGVETARAAALATLASGTAIVIAPAVLGLLGQGAGLRASFLVTLPLLAALVVVAKPPTGS